MAWDSVRVRLTLWNIVVLALVLSGFGALMSYSVRANQFAAIDRDLGNRADQDERRGIPPPLVRHFVPNAEVPEWPEDLRMPVPPPGEPADDGAQVSGGRRRVLLREDRIGEGYGLVLRSPDGKIIRGRREWGAGPMPRATVPGFEMEGQREFRRPLFFNLAGKPTQFHPDDLPWDPATFASAVRGERVYSTVTVDGERVRVVSGPLRWNGKVVGVAQFAHPLGEQERLADSQTQTLFLLVPFAVVVAGLGGLMLTNRALRPLREATQAAAEIGAHDLSRRLKVTGKDEFADLARTFNGMIARLEEAFRSLGSAHRKLEDAYGKLEAAYREQQRFTGDASHELRTPLTRIKGSTSLALCGPHDADSYREALEVADQAADVMSRIVQDLLLLARADADQLVVRHEPVSVEVLLSRAICTFDEGAGPQISLELPPDPLEVSGDADHLTRVFVNLLENARRHTPPEGRITVSASRDQEHVRITVADTGEGIPPEHLPRVAERFYRVDTVRTGGQGGTGLGLSICQSILHAHRGTMTITSEVGKGTTVAVRLPAASIPCAE